jgi:hypothetical protein
MRQFKYIGVALLLTTFLQAQHAKDVMKKELEIC